MHGLHNFCAIRIRHAGAAADTDMEWQGAGHTIVGEKERERRTAFMHNKKERGRDTCTIHLA